VGFARIACGGRDDVRGFGVMIVIVLSRCPDSLRGDLCKWFIEISVNVYIGNVSTRIRDYLWERICSTVRGGKAVMAYNTNTVQGFEFRTKNADWDVIELDMINLIRRPLKTESKEFEYF